MNLLKYKLGGYKLSKSESESDEEYGMEKRCLEIEEQSSLRMSENCETWSRSGAIQAL